MRGHRTFGRATFGRAALRGSMSSCGRDADRGAEGQPGHAPDLYAVTAVAAFMMGGSAALSHYVGRRPATGSFVTASPVLGAYGSSSRDDCSQGWTFALCLNILPPLFIIFTTFTSEGGVARCPLERRGVASVNRGSRAVRG
jgi:hypothetical protein